MARAALFACLFSVCLASGAAAQAPAAGEAGPGSAGVDPGSTGEPPGEAAGSSSGAPAPTATPPAEPAAPDEGVDPDVLGRGPVIELAPEEAREEASPQEVGDDAAPDEPPDTTYLRGMQQQRLLRARVTPLGGYGELHFNLELPEDGGDPRTQVDLHRVVLFVAHSFSDELRFYMELEVEHAVVGGGDAPGEVAVEQAFLDYQLLGEALVLRAGIVLVPMGILNQWHEPPIFHGVERPDVDRLILPSTWAEGGAGFVGQLAEGLRYELYVTGGLDALGFRGASGIRGGRQGVAEALAGSPALTGRIEIEPMLGLIVGASGYFNLAGRSAQIDLDVPVVGVGLDARLRWRGVEARAVASYFSIGDVDALRAFTDAEGNALGVDVGSALFGAYAELGYDVLNLADTDHALVPFARFEWYDTTFDEGATGYDRPSVSVGVFGLTYRPTPQVSVKLDYTLRRPFRGAGSDTLNLGVGWMY